jgi:3',5'-cyclic AMP phosphodiesterase CpdA
MPMPCYFIQLSDTHIVADIQQEHHGVNTYASLSRAMMQISRLNPPPACVIFTGDLINDDQPQSYRNLKQLTDRLTVPTYFAMGNHDVRQPFRAVFLGESVPSAAPYYYTFEVGTYRGIVLDSLVEGEVGGAIDTAQCAWLRMTLATDPQRPTVVFVHHPPAPIGIAWLDEHVLSNSSEVLDLLATHGNVRRVFFGHVHMALQLSVRGVQCTSIPSSCYQFGDTLITPKISPGPPGYGVVALRDDSVSSRVIYF